MAQERLRQLVGGLRVFARAAEYDSNGNHIANALINKANVSDMGITAVSGDQTKKNIQLANGLSQDVLVAHQDISGKQDSLTFDGTYNASTNPAATVSTVTTALSTVPVSTAIAPEYNAQSTYTEGVRCMHMGELFQCNTAIVTAEAWTPAHWTQTTVAEAIAAGVSEADKFEIFEASDSGGSSVFPTYAQITAALADGKIPVLKRTNLDNGNKYFYICSLVDEVVHGVWFRGLEDNNLLVVDSTDGWAEHGDTAKAGSVALDYGDLTFPVNERTYCMHDGYLYYCSVSGGIATSEPWTAAHWTGANITSIISDVANNPVKNGGALTSAANINVPNNAVSTLSTSEANLTLNVNVGATEVPNFAVEITAGAAITLTVTKTVGSTVTTLYASAAGGNTLENGKLYQLTCVGNCWTLAEFTVPTP